jgi:NADPH:quinone reductase-like Zn-dependent oxidoreductase
MKAIVQHAYGAADALKLEDIDEPAIKDDEVLIRVRAAAVNHADWVMATGLPLIGRLAFGLRKPKKMVRGRDVAGEVEAVGNGVTQFRPDDEVFAEVETGSFAVYTVASEDLLALKPANLAFEEAATVPLAANTALQGLRDVGKVKPGQKVVINGASGGVGTFAIQIAKAFGAEVTGACSTRNMDLVRAIGADHVIDYTRENFTRGGRRYDLIFDLMGNHPLTECRHALTRKGTLVLSSGTGGRVLGPLGRILKADVGVKFDVDGGGTYQLSEALRPSAISLKNTPAERSPSRCPRSDKHDLTAVWPSSANGQGSEQHCGKAVFQQDRRESCVVLGDSVRSPSVPAVKPGRPLIPVGHPQVGAFVPHLG